MNKKFIFSISTILIFFFTIELIGHTAYFLKRDRSFWSYHLKKIEGYIHYTPHGLNRWKPNVIAHMPGYPDFLKTDRYGFIHNGEDRLIEKQNYNIFIIGGSTVEGRGSSSNNKTIAARLEFYLKEKYSKKIRVINAGFSGDTTYQELTRVFGHLLPNFPVDMIISISGRNDAHNVMYRGNNYKINIDNEAFELFEKNFNKNINSCVSCAFIDKLNRYSITFYSLNYYIKKFYKKENKAYNLKLKDLDFSIPAKNTFNNLSTLNHRLKLEGVEYIAFIQPTLLEELKIYITPEEKLYKDKWIEDTNYSEYFIGIEKYYSYIKKYTNEWLYDLSTIFIKNDENLYWDSVHYNDIANDLIAKSISEIILDKNTINLNK